MKAFVFAVLAAALALSAAEIGVSGKWSGTATLARPDGATEDGSVFAILKQEGALISGTGGPDEATQWPIVKGSIAGNKVTLEVKEPADGTIYKCDLVLEGDHLKGPFTVVTADGRITNGRADFSRVK